MREIRTVVAEVSAKVEVEIENGVISSEHLHLSVVITFHVAFSDFVPRGKDSSLHKVQQEFSGLKKIYWERRFWESATSEHIRDEFTNEYINKRTDAYQLHYARQKIRVL